MKRDSFFSYGYTGMHHPCYTKLTLGYPLLLLKRNFFRYPPKACSGTTPLGNHRWGLEILFFLFLGSEYLFQWTNSSGIFSLPVDIQHLSEGPPFYLKVIFNTLPHPPITIILIFGHPLTKILYLIIDIINR